MASLTDIAHQVHAYTQYGHIRRRYFDAGPEPDRILTPKAKTRNLFLVNHPSTTAFYKKSANILDQPEPRVRDDMLNTLFVLDTTQDFHPRCLHLKSSYTLTPSTKNALLSQSSSVRVTLSPLDS